MKHINWKQKVLDSAKQWNHTIYKITTINGKIARRSLLFWSCRNHPNGGSKVFGSITEFRGFLEENLITDFTQEEIKQLFTHQNTQKFYGTRMDLYLNPRGYGDVGLRKHCCEKGYKEQRKEIGYEALLELLKKRGQHYNTVYTLLFSKEEYKNKYEKCLIRCESHGEVFEYGLMALQGFTSCPCPVCRKDPNHKNRAVESVKKINGRSGRGTRHRSRVLQKYGNVCFLSESSFQLHFHHLDSQDYYTSLSNLWEVNGIPLCGVVHRNYHYVFLKKYSLVKNEYSCSIFSHQTSEEKKQNPDCSLEGIEVSRYTFCEFLRFLIYDIQTNGTYVSDLNKQIEKEHEIFVKKNPQKNTLWKPITLDKTIHALEKFCAEYKGENWAMAENSEIPFANNPELWRKVENSWNV